VGVAGVTRSERVSGGPGRYCVTVGISTLEMDGPLGEVDLERTLDGGRWSLELPCDCDCGCDELLGSGVLADWTCVGSCGDGACDDVGCTIPV